MKGLSNTAAKGDAADSTDRRPEWLRKLQLGGGRKLTSRSGEPVIFISADQQKRIDERNEKTRTFVETVKRVSREHPTVKVMRSRSKVYG